MVQYRNTCASPVWLLVLVTILTVLLAAVHAADDRVTKKESEMVARFRPLVQDLIYKDWMNADEYLIRWLRARKGNPKGAREMLKAAMDWRKENRIDGILAEDFSDVEKEFSVMFEGRDRHGHPIAIFNVGAINLRKVAISGQIQRMIRYFWSLMELTETTLRRVSNENGTFTRALFIADLHGFSLRIHACGQCIPFGLVAFGAYESYYPDRVYRLFAINAPRIFMPFYEIVRPLASETSLSVLELLDNDRERWRKRLLKEIAEDQLPVQYGGKLQVIAKTVGDLRKKDPLIKAVYDEAEAEAAETKQKKLTS